MPRSPSQRILRNRCSVYQSLSGPDGEGGPQFPVGPVLATNVQCSVQYTGTEEIVEDMPGGLARVSVRNVYKIMFGSYQNYPPRTQIVQTDIYPNRTLLVQAAPPSEAGRDQAYVMRCIEVL
jgi:hypothetical protein